MTNIQIDIASEIEHMFMYFIFPIHQECSIKNFAAIPSRANSSMKIETQHSIKRQMPEFELQRYFNNLHIRSYLASNIQIVAEFVEISA